MTAIILRNSSGGWEYKTTTDDPLFGPILGSMVEEGMILPDTLVIEGALGEALEREWKYIEELQEWMIWEQKTVSEVVPPNYLDMSSLTLDVRMSSVSRYPYSPPGPVVYRHNISILSNALSLPTGWEAYTAVDEHTPLIDRVVHMRASLEYLRVHKDHAALLYLYMDNQVGYLYRKAEDPVVQQESRRYNYKYEGSLLSPFIRNAWFVQIDKEGNVDRLTLPGMLAKLDWEAVLPILTPYAEVDRDTDVSALLVFARSMTGEIVPDDEIEEDSALLMSRSMNDGISYISPISHDKNDNLDVIYTKLLDNLPEDVDVIRLGLEPILGEKKVKTWMEVPNVRGTTTSSTSRVTLNQFVGWVNAVVLTYQKWYSTAKDARVGQKQLYKAPGKSKNITIDREKFNGIVQFLGNTLGLYAMRRILLSLLYYVSGYAEKKLSKAQQEKVDRAEEFASLLEEYLTEHDGEDENVHTLSLSQVVSNTSV